MKQVKGDEELGEKADYTFHQALSAASQNPLLSKLLEHVSGLMVETMKETRRLWLFSKQTSIEKLYEEHLAIYNAIEEQDEEKARQAMLLHLENVEEILRKYFEETGS
jgi:GntR family transcriptional repressor for pyruvate dehydrogenase complex